MSIFSIYTVTATSIDASLNTNVELMEPAATTKVAVAVSVESENFDNYRLLSRKLSGRQEEVEKKGFDKLYTGMSYLDIRATFRDREVVMMEHGSRSTQRRGGKIALLIPVRGGETGKLSMNYEAVIS